MAFTHPGEQHAALIQAILEAPFVRRRVAMANRLTLPAAAGTIEMSTSSLLRRLEMALARQGICTRLEIASRNKGLFRDSSYPHK